MPVGRIFDVALGREVQYYINVQTNTPSTAAIGVLALATSGLEADTVLITKATVAAVLAGTTNEPTNTGYARIVLTDSDLAAYAPDTTNHWGILDSGDLLWTSVAVTGGAWSKLVYYYDPDPATSTDSTRIPLTLHDFAATPGGGNVTATVAGFCKVIDRVTAGV